LATWRRRAVGFFLDVGLMAIVPFVLAIAFGASLPNAADAPPSPISDALGWVLLASLGVVVVYPAWFIGRRGQTPGMKRMQIRLYRMDAEGNLSAPGWGRAWGRSATAFVVLCLFDAGWLVYALWPLGNDRRQCLHDEVARTIAVDVRDGACWARPPRPQVAATAPSSAESRAARSWATAS